ncbi:hypothetical protein Clacol_000019 [Clathrus columnatus]|uniref:Uncharacterized protein n=1 Tax=Clathrus columnatus TaxID=1419009 RepID=A0AAV4ZXX4_9AGAM|nr:hypothetical protein Clacol_000019 [Clathrus columnatus]
MGGYLCMRWSGFPEFSPVHCHEVFKRLFLKEIFRMTNEDKPIPIRGPRPPLLTLTDESFKEKGSSDASRQSRGSQKRRSSTFGNRGPPKKQRHRREITLDKLCLKEDEEVICEGSEPEGTVVEELDTEDRSVEANTSLENALVDKFRENLANDAK